MRKAKGFIYFYDVLLFYDFLETELAKSMEELKVLY